MSKITKTTILLIVTALLSLIIPIFGEWYYHKTNIQPILFYIVSANGGLGIVIIRLYSIWNND
jgi:hypothetical protein